MKRQHPGREKLRSADPDDLREAFEPFGTVSRSQVVTDRETGRPVWPIEERPVPTSKTPGEKTARTQPFTTRPKPFDLHGLTVNDLIDQSEILRHMADSGELTLVGAYYELASGHVTFSEPIGGPAEAPKATRH